MGWGKLLPPLILLDLLILSCSLRTLIIDHYDSYTYNLVHLVAEVTGVEPIVVDHDYGTIQDITRDFGSFDNIILSPGPGRPDHQRDFMLSKDVITNLSSTPILGVCLGHQGIGYVYGGKICRAPVVKHGRLSRVNITDMNCSLFQGIPNGFSVVRYHSLRVILDEKAKANLKVTAFSDDGVIMGLQHIHHPHYGVQFHPESVCTEYGHELMQNFDWLSRVATGKLLDKLQVFPRGLKKERECDDDTTSATVYTCPLPFMENSAELFDRIFDEDKVALWLDTSDTRQGRYSFMFTEEDIEEVLEYFESDGDALYRRLRWEGSSERIPHMSVMSYLEDRMKIWKKYQLSVQSISGTVEDEETLPFKGGYVGYLGYECRHEALRILSRAKTDRTSTPVCEQDDNVNETSDMVRNQRIPDAMFFFVKRGILIDHQKRLSKAFHLQVSPKDDRQRILSWMMKCRELVETPKGYEKSDTMGVGEGTPPPSFEALDDDNEYMLKIRKIQQEISKGETYEACLTTQFRARRESESWSSFPKPWTFYQKLRLDNPAPYSAFVYAPNRFSICCSSPERFLKCKDGVHIESKPIKGTVKRGESPLEDSRAAAALQQDEKNRAENLMIVDLLRNDFSRICKIGTVRVPKLMAIESYATVHQMVSTITGELANSMNVIDALIAAFPGGSMTGAPKKRTCEILHSLEERRPRGIYSGTLGYISIDGRSDMNIMIRSAILTSDEITVGAGGAITALSDPYEEVKEMRLKANSVLRSMQLTRLEESDAI